MAAPGYTTDLTVLNACDSNTTPVAWTNLGTGSDATETDYFIHNGACISKPFNITAGGLYATVGATTFNAGDHYWIWCWFGAPNAMLAEASGGYQALVGSSSTAYDLWNVMGSDTNPYGGWRCVPVDIVNVTRDARVGTPSGTYSVFGCYCNTSVGIGKGNPLGIDVIRKGRGELRINGGDITNGYATIAGAAAVNDNPTTGRYGLCQAQDGTYLIQGFMILGYTSAVDFRDSNKTLIIANTKKVLNTFNRIEVRQSGSRVDWTNINITALGTVSRGRFEMVDAADVNFDTCVFTDMDTFIFLSSASVIDCTFRRCNLITANGADLRGSVVASSTVAADASALLWNVATDTDGKLDNMTFVRGTNAHHAIELGPNTPTSITLRGVTVSGFNASNSQNDSVIYNNSGKSITINVTGNTGTISYKNGSGASTSIVSDQRTIFINVRNSAGALITDATEITLVRTSDTTVLHTEENVTDGSTSYTYAYSSNVACYVNVVSTGLYVPKTVDPVTLINADQTIDVYLDTDRIYST